MVDLSTRSPAVPSIRCPSLMEFAASNELPSQPVSTGAIAEVVDIPGTVQWVQRSGVWEPMARLHGELARELTTSLLPINRMLAPLPSGSTRYHCGFMSTSGDLTTRLHANSEALHEAEVVRKRHPPVGTPEGTSNRDQRYKSG